ncbi:hypothetical protein IW492_00935 [Enterococcus sp. BWB1-3]|nr:hypothetical protein [Enterococcus sp. BWB1-3]
MQNIQLLTWERGIDIAWRTTKNFFDSELRLSFGIPSDEQIVGSFQLTKALGKTTKTRRRKALSE